MKSRKRSFFRKRKNPVKYGMEVAILCILLVVAAYVGNQNKAVTPTSPSRETTSPHTESRKTPVNKEQLQTKTAPPHSNTTKAHQSSVPVAKSKAQRADVAGKSDSQTDKQEYRLLYIGDGDSFELIDEHKRKLRVRLYGIDAPEVSQNYGKESREHLMQLLRGKKIRLKTIYQDNYQRAVAIVYLTNNGKIDNLSVNQRQVQNGMAWVYDYFCTNTICNTWKLEEALAQRQKLGLWKESRPTPPWQWRRSHSKN
jgi:endonuclease YncB( thermonuclease family)